MDVGGLAAGDGQGQGQPARRSSLTELPLTAAEAGLRLPAAREAEGAQTLRDPITEATNRDAGDDDAEKAAYELASSERDALFGHVERSSGSDESNYDGDAADGQPGIGTGGLGMSEYAGSRAHERILAPNQIGDSGSNYGPPGRGGGRRGRQQSSTVYRSHGDGLWLGKSRTGGAGEPAEGRPRHQKRDSMASLMSSGMLSHGGASQVGGGNQFGADRSQCGRSSTASFMSASRSVSKLMDRSASRRAVFRSKYG